MKQNFYVIMVTPNYGKSDAIHTLSETGYYTSTYQVNRGLYVGYEANPEYKNVSRFKNRITAERVTEKLKNQQFGGETFGVDYDFKIEQVELEVMNKPNKLSKSSELNKLSKMYLREQLHLVVKHSMDGIKLKYGNTYTEEQYNEISLDVYNNANKMLKSLGTIRGG